MAYREVFLLTAAVCLVCFHVFRMYSPLKSLLNVEEFKAIVKSTATALLVVFTLLSLLRPSSLPPKGKYEFFVVLHDWLDIEVDPDLYSRLTVVIAFFFILLLTTVSRFISFRLIQMLHKRGIGNRNVLIVGTGETAIKLQKKFVLVPTLGLNLIGFVTDKDEEVGGNIWGANVLGKTDELDLLISRHKISEVFVAAPEESEEYLMAIVERLEQLGVVYRVVPRFYHFMSHKVRIENLDSIPLISRPERRPALVTLCVKRCLDIVIVLAVMIVALPFFLISAALIKRESKGPAFFYQTRIGLNGKAVQDDQVPHDARGVLRRRSQAQGRRRPARDEHRSLAAPLQPGRAAPAVQRAQGRDERRRTQARRCPTSSPSTDRCSASACASGRGSPGCGRSPMPAARRSTPTSTTTSTTSSTSRSCSTW